MDKEQRLKTHESLRCTIVIEVYEGSTRHSVQTVAPGITIFEITGALDYLKNVLFFQQNRDNMAKWAGDWDKFVTGCKAFEDRVKELQKEEGGEK